MADEGGKRSNLGRGLSALLGGAPEPPRDEAPRVPRALPIEQLHPGRFQPRRHFADEAIEALAQSIRENGILQPLVVRRHPGLAGAWEIVAGERRWRAAQLARLHEVPVVVRELSDRAALEIALVENVQRQDLLPLEEAEGYRRLIEEFAYTQEALAQQLGKSRSHIANMLRLLKLPEPVRRLLDEGTISAGHARALLSAADPAGLARRVAAEGLSVRQTERLAGGARPQPRRKASRQPAAPDPDIAALERELTGRLGLAVHLRSEGESGSLTIRYETLEQLDDVLARLRGGPA
ncbi:MAG: ParB/RepB/Spo0J family partition protein [Dongiaceae bacterium]